MPSPSQYSDEELASLTEEERAGLADDSLIDEGDEGQDAAKPANDNADPAKPANDNAAATDPEVAAAPAPAPAPGDAPTPAPANDNREHANENTRQAPPDYDASIATMKTQLEDLASKFDEGELTAVEYQQQRGAIDDQLIETRMQRHDYTRRAEDTLATYTNDTVPAFLKQHEAAYPANTPPYFALDHEVRRLQVEAANEGRDQFSRAILDQAHTNVSRYFGGATKAPANDNNGLGARDLPPQLSGLPAASGGDDMAQGGKFAYLDRLSPEDLETEMAKMPDAEREAYLRNT